MDPLRFVEKFPETLALRAGEGFRFAVRNKNILLASALCITVELLCDGEIMTHIADPIDQVPKALGRTITPYVGQTLIYIGVSVFLVYVAIKTSKFNTLWALGVMWPLYAFSTLYFGLKYRVLWDDAGVIMRASGGPERRIQYAEITRIELETGVSQSRPLRRIVVYGPKHHSNGFIDISLRHFRLEDIRQLFQMIQARRHDLTLPKVQFERGFW